MMAPSAPASTPATIQSTIEKTLPPVIVRASTTPMTAPSKSVPSMYQDALES
jgi:hypothetical protein